MKNILHLLAAPTLALCCAAGLSACHQDGPQGPNKTNPTAHDLAACAFELSVQDCERGFSPDSNYVFEGVCRDGKFYFGEDKRDEMVLNITPDNRIILIASAEDSGFEGVNAASSSQCINIVPDGSDHTRYELQWVAEGESTITLWNGEGASRREIRFTATSKKEIPLEGIAFRYDGMVYKFQKVIPTEHVTEGAPYYTLLHKWDSRKENLDYLPTFELIGPIPLNATPTLLYLMQIFHANIPSDEDRVYGKEVSAYEYNTRLYKEFSWFPEYYRPAPPDGYNEQNWETCPIAIQKEWQQKFLDSKLKVYPADLRERRIKFWMDGNSELNTGGYAIYLDSEDAHIEIDEANNFTGIVAHTTYQIGLSGK